MGQTNKLLKYSQLPNLIHSSPEIKKIKENNKKVYIKFKNNDIFQGYVFQDYKEGEYIYHNPPLRFQGKMFNNGCQIGETFFKNGVCFKGLTNNEGIRYGTMIHDNDCVLQGKFSADGKLLKGFFQPFIFVIIATISDKDEHQQFIKMDFKNQQIIYTKQINSNDESIYKKLNILNITPIFYQIEEPCMKINVNYLTKLIEGGDFKSILEEPLINFDYVL
jgi:hypothetical protein